MGIKILALTLTLVACAGSSVAPDSTGIVAHINGDLFTRDPETGTVEVPFTIENKSPDTVYISRCGDRVSVSFDRWSDGQWTEYASAVCLAVYPMSEIPFPPGQEIGGIRLFHKGGKYRLQVHFSRDRSYSAKNVTRTSAPFVVQ